MRTLILTLSLLSLAAGLGTRAHAEINYTYLDQGWTWAERERFWLLGQGSEIMPFEWFLHLEQADSQALFIHPDNIRRLGYIPWPTASGVDMPAEKQVPIGFTRAANPHTGEVWLGMNCSACHTNLVRFNDTTLLIDGAPTLGDYWQFNLDVTAALNRTLTDDDKFTRFAERLGVDTAERMALRNKLTEVVADRVAYNERNQHEIRYGHGRLDAIGFIFNEVVAGRLAHEGAAVNSGIPENRRAPEAPVSYPFLWGTAQADYVQWNGVSFAQTPIGNLARDTVEVLGVYGRIEIDCENNSFKSSVLFRESKELGDMTATLRAPAWPSDVLPPVDLEVAHAGEQLYGQFCASCHEVIPAKDWNKPYKSGLWPMEMIGTDMRYGASATQWVDSGCLEGETIMRAVGPALKKTATSYSVVTHVALGALSENFRDAILPNLSTRGLLTNLEDNGLALREPRPIYKARPLNGIWATAPYLHNGSVANLDDLLKPPAERAAQVTAGCPDFDPEKVGFTCEAGSPGTTTIDVSCEVPDDESVPISGKWVDRNYHELPFRSGRVAGVKATLADTGNCNLGHDIRKATGEAFTDEERRQLVEFLKTL